MRRASWSVRPSCASKTSRPISARSRGFQGDKRAGLLNMLMNARTPSHAGGIDQQKMLALPDQPAINGIARRPRSGVNNGALSSYKTVEERRFADIGTTNDGEPEVGFDRWSCCVRSRFTS